MHFETIFGPEIFIYDYFYVLLLKIIYYTNFYDSLNFFLPEFLATNVAWVTKTLQMRLYMEPDVGALFWGCRGVATLKTCPDSINFLIHILLFCFNLFQSHGSNIKLRYHIVRDSSRVFSPWLDIINMITPVFNGPITKSRAQSSGILHIVGDP